VLYYTSVYDSNNTELQYKKCKSIPDKLTGNNSVDERVEFNFEENANTVKEGIKESFTNNTIDKKQVEDNTNRHIELLGKYLNTISHIESNW